VVLRHVVRNALIPLATVISLTFGGLLGGAIVTETVFTLDGMGFFFITKLGQLDLYAVMGYLLVTSVIIIACNLFADVMYGFLDPRIRLN
jgi:peptide/nickel transport system permease protein